MDTVKKSIGAAFLISLGVYGILVIENTYVSALLFSLGLLTICVLGLNLFTGKCGFIFESKKWKELFIILVVNMLAGYIFGLIYSVISSDLITFAQSKISTWDISVPYFIKSVLCGAIMYIAVKLYKEGTVLGIIIGIPMFILCGFQHCIANVITMGVARTFNPALIVATIGNFAGSLLVWYLSSGISSKNK